MQATFHVRKGDTVVVISGSERGKTGQIIRVDRKKNRVYIEGVKMMTHYQRPQDGSEGIVKKEGPIHVSNVMHLDPKTQKPTRIGYKMVNDKKVRFAKKSGELIDKE
jgi:large subunit ribosomal protein L24